MSEGAAASAKANPLLHKAVAARAAGRRDEAERLCRRILARQPQDLPATHLLAILAAENGQTTAAIALLRKVVERAPESLEALNQLVALLRIVGPAGEAVAFGRQAEALAPNHAATQDNLGLALLAERRIAEAAVCFARAVRLDPLNAEAHRHLGMALQVQGHDAAAATAFGRAIALAPGAAEPHLSLGELHQSKGRLAEAIASFRRAVAAQPRDPASQLALAAALAENGEAKPAEHCVRAAVALDPASGDAHWRLGSVLSQLGRFAEARASFERALELQPRHTASFVGILSAQKVSAADRPIVERMEALLGAADLADRDRLNLHYGLGKAADDLGDHSEAMRHFDAANRIALEQLRLGGRAFDRERHAAAIDRLIATFTPDLFAGHAALGCDSELPILILGMMRSGTTLTEQILSSHPDIAAGDELAFWGEREARLGAALAAGLDREKAAEIAGAYLAVLRAIAPQARRVTDKMPANFLQLGYIHLLFPRARIIHCRRDPLDTCLSIYFTPYSRSPSFAHDPGNIAFFYEQYARLMAHWRRILPAERFMEIDYETLVADREGVAREMIAFCGLDWSDACLSHEDNARVVRTASMWQARQPIYRSSVERWRRYEPWLGEFRRLLPPQ